MTQTTQIVILLIGAQQFSKSCHTLFERFKCHQYENRCLKVKCFTQMSMCTWFRTFEEVKFVFKIRKICGTTMYKKRGTTELKAVPCPNFAGRHFDLDPSKTPF
jgi:hypothetical protein